MNYAHGSPTFLAQGYIFVAENMTVDPQAGVRYEQVFEGTEAGINTLADIHAAAGAAIRFDIAKPGVKRLVSVWGRAPNIPSSSEAATDRWDLSTEQKYVSVWSSPYVIAESYTYVDQPSYRKEIEAAVAAGAAFPFSTTSFPVGYQVYLMLFEGEDSWPQQLIVLRRARTFTNTYPTRMQLLVTQNVYTTARLIADFGVPTAVQSQLPLTPAAAPPPYAIYGWRWSYQASGYTAATHKYDEQLMWEFKTWPTQLYTIIS